jgi:phage N-6-adenine-methyltransferase
MSNKKTTADPNHLAYVGSKPNTRKANDLDKSEWYTPGEWIEVARNIMGSIALDPFSNEKANLTVKADRFFTIEDDALSVEWNAETVWMNPPYGRGLCGKAIEKLVFEFEAGRVGSAIVLVNSATDTAWYARLLKAARSEAFTVGRISFIPGAEQTKTQNTSGQTFVLLTHLDHIEARFIAQMAIKGLVARTPLLDPDLTHPVLLSRGSRHPALTELSEDTLSAIRIILDFIEDMNERDHYDEVLANEPMRINPVTHVWTLTLTVGEVVRRAESAGVATASASEMDAIELLSQYVVDAADEDEDEAVYQAARVIQSSLGKK